jgi:NAD(P)-dependent dehydrogenase (short-subunit alcohol dehydrogenase family)
MTTTTYLITGASRGLGLETARQLLAISPHNLIIAAARDPPSATQLQALVAANEGRIVTVALDVTSEASVAVRHFEPSTSSFLLGLTDLSLQGGCEVGGTTRFCRERY